MTKLTTFFLTLLIGGLSILALKLYIQPLTLSEKWFALMHDPVKVGAELNYPPYMHIENGQVTGLAVDYLKLVTGKTGLRFDYTSQGALHELLPRLEKSEIDIVTSVRDTPERSTYALFTPPFAYVGTVLVVNPGTERPKTVAVGRGFAIEAWLKRNRTELVLVPVSSDEDALLLLKHKQVDAAALDEVSLAYLQRRLSFNSGIAYNLPHSYPLAFAVSKSQVELHRVLSKAITGISLIDKRALIEQLNQ